MVFLPAMRRWILAVALVALAGCRPQGPVDNPTFNEASEARDPIAVYEALEALIEAQKDTKDDREDAYAVISGLPDDGSAAYAFARAAVAGRLAENRGLQAGGLVGEAEEYARRVRDKDPDFRDGAATRMLGTLYVLAPSRLVSHGDSETGLEILEEEVEAHPGRASSRVRLAEAYIALGDPDPATEHLCRARAAQSDLGVGERRLLARLIEEVGGEGALACPGPDGGAGE